MSNGSDDILYRKVGRRYVPVGVNFIGFPAEGVWLVSDQPGKSFKTHLMCLGDIPDPMPLAQMEHHRSVAARAMADFYREAIAKTHRRNKDGSCFLSHPSLDKMITAFFKALAKAETEAKLGKKQRVPW